MDSSLDNFCLDMQPSVQKSIHKSIHKSYLQHMRRSTLLSDSSKSEIKKALAQPLSDPDRNFIDWALLKTTLLQINATEPSGWASSFVRSIGVAAHGPLGFAALSANTLADGLSLLKPYFKTRMGIYDIDLVLSEGNAQLTFIPLVERDLALEIVDEMVCACMTLMISTVLHSDSELQGGAKGISVLISAAAIGLEKNFPDIVVEQRKHGNAILSFPGVWMNYPSQYADEHAFESNLHYVQLQSSNLGSKVFEFSTSIRNLLERFFDNNSMNYLSSGRTTAAPTLEMVASGMHISPRTLIRRLKAENTSYKNILQAQRQNRAKKILRDTNISVEEVALVLAYSDTGNFIRAFQSWTGMTPISWRKSHRMNDSTGAQL